MHFSFFVSLFLLFSLFSFFLLVILLLALNISKIFLYFLQEIDIITGYRTRSMMCHPIKDSLGDVIGVAQVINKANEAHFTANDEAVFEKYLQFCGIGLRNAQLYERSQLEVSTTTTT